MPKRKPQALNKRKTSNDERAARASQESMVKPSTELTITPPAELKGKKIACSVWKRVLSLQAETQAAKDGAPIITAFDAGVLVRYCKMAEEERTLESKLEKLDRAQDDLYKKVSKMRPTKETLKDYLSMWTQFNGASGNYKGMSARLDAHRNSMHDLEKSMYLTPSSRAGVAPQAAEPETPKSEIEELMGY